MFGFGSPNNPSDKLSEDKPAEPSRIEMLCGLELRRATVHGRPGVALSIPASIQYRYDDHQGGNGLHVGLEEEELGELIEHLARLRGALPPVKRCESCRQRIYDKQAK